MTNPSLVEEIFLAAAEKSPAERPAYLDAACKQNLELRRQVERLLAAHPKAAGFLEVPAVAEHDRTANYDPMANRAVVIIAGRYKLLEQIGAGGMGEVWMADQSTPIKRRVAIKLIKAGLDSRNVLSRFEAERQALAVMDHPHIAKVLDAGSMEDGRPYFVMELVKGVPITNFCDARKLSPKERLALFIPVCHAIQHAHQKGVIHRDIKPSNVLVELHDDKPVPKVIDFGLAKAVGQPLTEHTLFTGFGSLVGTPTYMAPEQASFNAIDVDTRVDVYALGILLYELLAGSPPLQPERFKQAALDEVLRMIREDDPPRPSQRLSTSEMKASIAAVRGAELAKLTAQIQGELDWIVMKALEKNRTRRYESASALAQDVANFLSGEAVLAHPPSAAYRFTKFVQKHKARVIASSAFVSLLVAATGVSINLTLKAQRAEQVAESKRQEAEKANRLSAQRLEERIGAEATANKFRIEAELAALSVRVDLELKELESDSRVGMLHLCATKRLLAEKRKTFEELPSMSSKQQLRQRLDDLDSFLTTAILTMGQDYASLLPPITHDGQSVVRLQVSPDNKSLLTLGADASARQWDMRTGRLISILRRTDERIVNCGYSSDGATIFTDDESGVARFWNGRDGSYRTEIARIKDIFTDNTGNRALREWHSRQSCMLIAADRLLTRRVSTVTTPKPVDMGEDRYLQYDGPVELWDTGTGQRVARLDRPGIDLEHIQFMGAGQLISIWEGREAVGIYAADDGRPVAKLSPEPGEAVHEGPYLSPDGSQIVILASNLASDGMTIHAWETRTWAKQVAHRLAAHNRPVQYNFILWNDGLCSYFPFSHVSRSDNADVYRLGDDTALASSIGWSVSNAKNPHRVIDMDGRVYSTNPWQPLPVGAGKKFHPDLAEFSPDGRFVSARVRLSPFVFLRGYRFHLIDLVTQKQFVMPDGLEDWAPIGLMPGIGSATAVHGYGAEVRFIPSLLSEVPADQLELWVQVALRGALNDEGAFKKWDESTWEKKQQELASVSSPIGDFPFPGHLVVDKLFWLRGEFESATDKTPLARQLLKRAETLGDQNEMVRWREWLKDNSPLNTHAP